MDSFEALPISFSLGALFVFGSIIGSFLGLVVHRYPLRLFCRWRAEALEQIGDFAAAQRAYGSMPPGIVLPRSRCPACRTPLKRHHTIPILGHLILKGRCGFCRAWISLRYPLIESVTATLFAASGYWIGTGPHLPAALVLVGFLILLAAIDLEHRILPDQLVGPLLFLGLAVNTREAFASLESAVWGAVAGYLAFRTVREVHRLVTGRPDGLGLGDCKLLAAIGAWVGWELLPATVAIAAVASVLCFAAMIVLGQKEKWSMCIPFGPGLAAGGLCSLYWGNALYP